MTFPKVTAMAEDNRQDELVAKSRRILDRAKKASRQEQLAELRRRGLIDDEGNVQLPPSGSSNGVPDSSSQDSTV